MLHLDIHGFSLVLWKALQSVTQCFCSPLGCATCAHPFAVSHIALPVLRRSRRLMQVALDAGFCHNRSRAIACGVVR